MTETIRKCQFSMCRRYRYTLWREWEPVGDWMFDPRPESEQRKYLMVIGLNPSIADETRDDQTIRRCIDFAKRWGFGALCMTNLFAWRDTKPAGMKRADDPVGPDNDHWLFEMSIRSGMILAAWGAHGAHLGRASTVKKLLADRTIRCLKLNDDGSPGHPLYIPANTVPIILP